jgi:AcrR family transcriptional regulator
VVSRKAGKTHEQARERTREALFRAGAEMLTESTARDPFAGIRIRELCERADYSTGAFYAHWPNAQAFYDELSAHFMSDVLVDDFDELKARAREAGEQPGAGAVLDLAEDDLRLLLENPHWDAVELLNLTLARTTHRDSAVRGYRTIDALTGRTYQLLLEPLGREPRPPLTWERIGVVLQGLVEGFGFRAKVDAESLRLPGLEHPQLYAQTVAAVLVSLTRPHGDRRDLEQSLADELAAPAPKRG